MNVAEHRRFSMGRFGLRLSQAFFSQRWNLAAFAWGLAEATLFFIVPDVLLSLIGIRQGPRAAGWAALAAALGAGLGGALMFWWSVSDPEAARAAVLAVPAVSEAMAAAAAAAMEENWFAATLAGPLTSTPYKLYAVLARQAGVHPLAFAAASVLARLPRFLLLGAGAGLAARWLEPRWGSGRLMLAVGGAWVLFYLAFFTLMPG